MIYLFLNTYKKLNSTIIFILLFVPIFQTIFSPPSFASENSIFTPYTKVTLENGLTIIVKEVHSAPIAAIDIRVAVGAINESPNQAGISHFVEHMLFKGTERRGVGEITREIKAVGGILNAETGLDTTNYFVVVPSEYLELAIDVEADAIQHSTFDPSEIDRERKVILEDIRIHQDRPFDTLGRLMMIEKVFAGTPYANSLVGNPETLNNINRETLLAYYRKHYVPNNMVVAVVGDVNTKQVLNQLTELFKDFKPGDIEPFPAVNLPKLKEIKRIEIEKDVQQSYIYLGFPAPLKNSKDSAALGVLRVLLGGCKSAKLNPLYGEGLVSNIFAESITFRDIGLFAIYAETQNPSLLEPRIQSILRRIIEDGVTDKEMALAKAVLQANFAFDAERVLTLACLMSSFEVNGSIEDRMEYERHLQEITKGDVQRVAREYVNPKHYTIITVKPREVK
ncbi:MAG: insulinase family protein [Firmicutes bacterium]|nr:insulinase family protein [Bacillota bacterium]